MPQDHQSKKKNKSPDYESKHRESNDEWFASVSDSASDSSPDLNAICLDRNGRRKKTKSPFTNAMAKSMGEKQFESQKTAVWIGGDGDDDDDVVVVDDDGTVVDPNLEKDSNSKDCKGHDMLEIPSSNMNPGKSLSPRQPLKPGPVQVLDKLDEKSINIFEDEVIIESLKVHPKRQSNSKNSTSYAVGKARGHNVDSRQNLKRHSNNSNDSRKVSTKEIECFCFPE